MLSRPLFAVMIRANGTIHNWQAVDPLRSDIMVYG
jgi:hypothetical protein